MKKENQKSQSSKISSEKAEIQNRNFSKKYSIGETKSDYAAIRKAAEIPTRPPKK